MGNRFFKGSLYIFNYTLVRIHLALLSEDYFTITIKIYSVSNALCHKTAVRKKVFSIPVRNHHSQKIKTMRTIRKQSVCQNPRDPVKYCY